MRPQEWSQENYTVGHRTDKMVNVAASSDHAPGKESKGSIFRMWDK